MRWVSALFFLCAATLLASCGGLLDGSTDEEPSPFRGKWLGVVTDSTGLREVFVVDLNGSFDPDRAHRVEYELRGEVTSPDSAFVFVTTAYKFSDGLHYAILSAFGGWRIRGTSADYVLASGGRGAWMTLARLGSSLTDDPLGSIDPLEEE